jgi:uncharacterized protein (DUF2267 family)
LQRPDAGPPGQRSESFTARHESATSESQLLVLCVVEMEPIMKLTGLDVFDNPLHKTNGWLRDVMLEMNWNDRRKAYVALRCVLHAVRDHLPADDAVRLGEDLPMLIRGFYFEHWNPSKPPNPSHNKEEFLLYCKDLGQETDADTEGVVRGVFRMLDRKVTEGEIAANPYLMLPEILQDLWPQTLQAA